MDTFLFVLANFFIRRLFWRFAAFLWIRPFAAALSTLLTASTSNSFTFSSLLATAVSNFFTALRIVDLTCALRAVRV